MPQPPAAPASPRAGPVAPAAPASPRPGPGAPAAPLAPAPPLPGSGRAARRPSAALALALLLALLAASPLHARQDTTGERSGRWATGASIGLPGHSTVAVPDLLVVSAHFTRLNPGLPGPDFAVGIMPRPLTQGRVAIVARAGVGVPFPLSDEAVLLPTGGATLFAGFGDGGGGGITGLHAGAAALVTRETGGFRIAASWHWFGGGADVTVWLLEVGFVSRRRR